MESRKVKAFKEEYILGITGICESRGKEYKILDDNIVQIFGKNLQGVIGDIKMRGLGIEVK
jgi:hypothetical protein